MDDALFDLKGQVALVTGASRGLGFAMAEALAKAGAHVIVNARDPGRVEAAVAALRGKGLCASAAVFDVTDEAEASRQIAAIAKEHGRLDILVANAGINKRAPLVDLRTEDCRDVLETNLVSVILIVQEAARVMVPRGAGRIIVVGSIAGQVGRPNIGVYAASKGGVMGLVKALAAELGPSGINVNAIAPGFFATDMNQVLLDDPAFKKFVEDRTALGRWGDPRELGGTAVFLASGASSFLTGQTITVDGGTMALM